MTCLPLAAMGGHREAYDIGGKNYSYACPGEQGQNFSTHDKLILNRAAKVAYNYAANKSIARNVGGIFGVAAGLLVIGALVKKVVEKATPVCSISPILSIPLILAPISILFIGAAGGVSFVVGTLGRLIVRKRLINEQKFCIAYAQINQTEQSLIGSLYIPQNHLAQISERKDIEKQPLERLIVRRPIINLLIEEPLLSKIKGLTNEGRGSFKYAFMNTIGTIERRSECERKESLFCE